MVRPEHWGFVIVTCKRTRLDCWWHTTGTGLTKRPFGERTGSLADGDTERKVTSEGPPESPKILFLREVEDLGRRGRRLEREHQVYHSV